MDLIVQVADCSELAHEERHVVTCEVLYNGVTQATRGIGVLRQRAMVLDEVRFACADRIAADLTSMRPADTALRVRVCVSMGARGQKVLGTASFVLTEALDGKARVHFAQVAQPGHCRVQLSAYTTAAGSKARPITTVMSATNAVAAETKAGRGITVGTQTTDAPSRPAPQLDIDVRGAPPSLPPTVQKRQPSEVLRPPSQKQTPQHDPHNIPGAMVGLESVKRLMAAWPRDEVEGLLVYCDMLRRQKADAERATARAQLDVARMAARSLRGPVAPPPGDERLVVTRVEEAHGETLSDGDARHVQQHYDAL